MDGSEERRSQRWWRRAMSLVRSPFSLLRRGSLCNRGSTQSLHSAPIPLQNRSRRRVYQPHNAPRARTGHEQSLSSQDTFKHLPSLLTCYAASNQGEPEQRSGSVASPQVEAGPSIEPARISSPRCEEIEIETVCGKRLIKVSDLTKAVNQAMMWSSSCFTENLSSYKSRDALFAIPLRMKQARRENVVASGEGKSALEGEATSRKASTEEGIDPCKEVVSLGKRVPEEEAAPHGETVQKMKVAQYGEGFEAEVSRDEGDKLVEAAPHKQKVSHSEAPPFAEVVPHEQAVPHEQKVSHSETPSFAEAASQGEAGPDEQKASHSETPSFAEAAPPGEAAPHEQKASHSEAPSFADAASHGEVVELEAHSEASADPVPSSSNSKSTPYLSFTSYSSDIEFQYQLIAGTTDMRLFLQFQEVVSPSQELNLKRGSMASTTSNQPSMEMDTVSILATAGGSPDSPPNTGPSNLYGEGPSGLCGTQHRAEQPPLLRGVTRDDIGQGKPVDTSDSAEIESSLSSFSPPSDQALALAQATELKSSVSTRKCLPTTVKEAPPLSHNMPASCSELDMGPTILPEEQSHIVPAEREPEPHETQRRINGIISFAILFDLDDSLTEESA